MQDNKPGSDGVRRWYGRDDESRTTPLWRRAADLGITLDVNATQGEYGQVANRAREFSDLRIVLDHCVCRSNFPTKLYNPKLSYVEALRLFSEAIDLSEAEREWVLSDTAMKLWKWG